MSTTKIRFAADGAVLSRLEVELPLHAPSFAAKLANVLFDLRVQVVKARATVRDAQRVEQLWLVEFDGAPLRRGRHLEIQDEAMRVVGDILRAARSTTRRRASPAPPDVAPLSA